MSQNNPKTLPLEALAVIVDPASEHVAVAKSDIPAGEYWDSAKNENELDQVLLSFALKNCRPNEGLIAVLKKHLNG